MVKLCFFVGAVALGAMVSVFLLDVHTPKDREMAMFLGGIVGALFGAFWLGKASS